MKTVLGLAGSVRRWGNSDVLIRQVLHGAELEGAAVRAIRLPDLHLDACTGCMRCVIGGEPCPLDDDLAWLIETIQQADGLALVAPTYFLAPAAVIKLVLDRMLTVMGRVDAPLPAVRPAVTIATAGLQSWRGVALPFLNALAGAFGFRPIDSLVALAPGPGEVLLDDALMAHVLDAGRRLGRGEMEAVPAAPNVCPICYGDGFVLDGARATCPICGCQAAIEWLDGQVRLRFEPEAGSGQRWTPQALRTHMIDWVQATGPRYAAQRAKIKELRAPFREMALEWLCPPGKEEERR